MCAYSGRRLVRGRKSVYRKSRKVNCPRSFTPGWGDGSCIVTSKHPRTVSPITNQTQIREKSTAVEAVKRSIRSGHLADASRAYSILVHLCAFVSLEGGFGWKEEMVWCLRCGVVEIIVVVG